MKVVFSVLCLVLPVGNLLAGEFTPSPGMRTFVAKKKHLYAEISRVVEDETFVLEDLGAVKDFELKRRGIRLSHLKEKIQKNKKLEQDLESKEAECQKLLDHEDSLQAWVRQSGEYSEVNPFRYMMAKSDISERQIEITKKIAALRDERSGYQVERDNIKLELKSIEKRSGRIKRKTERLNSLNAMLKTAISEMEEENKTPTDIMAELQESPLMGVLGSMAFRDDPEIPMSSEILKFYSDYQQQVKTYNRNLNRSLYRLESVQNFTSGHTCQYEVLKKVREYFSDDPDRVTKVMEFYTMLSQHISWYKVSAAAIASEEVNGDQSMLFGGREVALAILEGSEGLTEEIPILKTIVRLLALAGMKYIHDRQVKDNQNFAYSGNSFINSQVLSFREAAEILNNLDLDAIAAHESPRDLCKPLAWIWRKAVLSCGLKKTIPSVNFTKSPMDLNDFITELTGYHERYIRVVGERFSEKIRGDSLTRRLFRWRNGLNKILL